MEEEEKLAKIIALGVISSNAGMAEEQEEDQERAKITCDGLSACPSGEKRGQATSLLSQMPEAKAQPDIVNYSAGIGARTKREQWQLARSLLNPRPTTKIEQTVTSYSAGIGACTKGERSQRALSLLGWRRV